MTTQTAKDYRPDQAHPQFRLCDAHRNVLSYVASNPGCCKYAAAAAGTYNSLRCPSKQYYLVNTLINHGYLLWTRTGNTYELYCSEDWEFVNGQIQRKGEV